MSYGLSVEHPADVVYSDCRRRRSRRATVEVITSDPFDRFVAELRRSSPTRISIASPWLSDPARGRHSLSRALAHARTRNASVVVVTRPPAAPGHAAAVSLLESSPRTRIHYNNSLHAKLYVCEEGRGRGFAVIGSGNATTASLDEVALLVRPIGKSAVVTEIANEIVRHLATRPRVRRRTGRRRAR